MTTQNPFEDFEAIHIDVGDNVVCDLCNKNWTDTSEIGGMIVESKAVCPDCEPRYLKSLKKYNEERFIKAICPEGMSFYDFILNFRSGGLDNGTT